MNTTQPRMTTCIADPWALIQRGGTTPGKRPATRMAFLTDAIPNKRGEIVAYRGFIMRADMSARTKAPRQIEAEAVLKQWRYGRQPTLGQIKAAKARLPVAKESGT